MMPATATLGNGSRSKTTSVLPHELHSSFKIAFSRKIRERLFWGVIFLMWYHSTESFEWGWLQHKFMRICLHSATGAEVKLCEETTLLNFLLWTKSQTFTKSIKNHSGIPYRSVVAYHTLDWLGVYQNQHWFMVTVENNLGDLNRML